MEEGEGHKVPNLSVNYVLFIKQTSKYLSQVLPLHTFTPRHFESEEGEKQPLSFAAREVARDRGAKKAAGTWQVIMGWELG